MKILLVDDHEVVRRGLEQMLAEELGAIDFGQAGSVAEALQEMRTASWDLVVLDINLPGRSGMDVLSELQGRADEPPVLVLSMAPEEEYALRALRKGAKGYLTKQTVANELIVAVRKILGGGRYVSAALSERLADILAAGGDPEPHTRLTDRELQVLRLIAEGRSVKEIAAALALSDKTIFTYRERLRSKLGIKSDVELARYALSNGLVD